MTEALAPVARTASATVLKTGTLPSNVWPPFPGVTPATTRRAVLQHLAGVERALAPGDALHQQPRVPVDEDAHAAPRASCDHLLDRLVHVAQRAHADALEDADKDT